MNSDINKDYISDAFTKENDEVNLEADNFNVSCITSKDNKFNLDSDGNLTVKSINVLEGNTLDMQNIFNVVYPIGSIYMSVNEVSPKVLFGGEWEKISGRVLVGEGTSDRDERTEIRNFAIGSKGGEFSHWLTVSEMPSHNHGIFSQCTETINNKGWVARAINGYDATQAMVCIMDNGDNHAHNNMPPYLVVSMWKRIA